MTGQMQLFPVPQGPGPDGQLDLVAAIHEATQPRRGHHPAAPAAARRLADELSAGTGLHLRALADGAITNAA